MARLSKELRALILEGVRLDARDNARETEGVSYRMSADGRSREYGPEIQAAYAGSVRSIGESIQSEREYRNYSYLPRVLTAPEAQSIVNELLKWGY
jgi:hypothetical protein